MPLCEANSRLSTAVS